MPYLKQPPIDHPVVVAVARARKRSRAQVARMHVQDLFWTWCETNPNQVLRHWGGSWSVAAEHHFHWPFPEDSPFEGMREFRSRGMTYVEIRELTAEDAFVRWMVSHGPNSETAELYYRTAVDLIGVTGWEFLKVEDLTPQKFAEALDQAGFKGTLIVKGSK